MLVLVLVWLSLFVWNKVQIVCIIYMVPLMPLYLKTPSSLAHVNSDWFYLLVCSFIRAL